MEPLEFEKQHSLVTSLLQKIREQSQGLSQIRLMEVCGTHTMEIGRLGLRAVLPSHLELLSGPGCPVCVTPGAYLDAAAYLALEHQVCVATFGDLVRVPGNQISLEQARAKGANIEVVTSPLQALEIAQKNKVEVVFLAVGFETTAPTTAMTIRQAKALHISNLSFFTAHRVVTPALEALIADPELQLSGFLLPGHVSTIIGESPYQILQKHGIPGVIAGFSALDILAAILDLVQMIQAKKSEIHNVYRRIAFSQGNPKAMAAVQEVFELAPAAWRGIGTLPKSGLIIRQNYEQYDAAKRFHIALKDQAMPIGCSCGQVLRGRLRPSQCPLFGKKCTPQTPVGPCMVSSEGSCAAYFHYEA